MNSLPAGSAPDIPIAEARGLTARLDKLENLLLSTAGTLKVFNLMQFGGGSKELLTAEDYLGDMLQEVLALKKDLGCTSTLTIVEDGPVEPM